ncbi:MAG TPA: COX15/CtaA family protein [Saprospiraceae bacterium]|nr:COX15/CtaA family protein [Saprospiraceae bacterium]HMQ81975.1 COX15/CtaA family protein [Saprospiraceae bacterium]
MNPTLSNRPSTQPGSAKKYPLRVKIWLLTGLVMIFMQVVIGGVTRLTGSGLSITKWEIITGTIPPLNAAQWEEAFAEYQQTPQYQKINEGMTMGAFRFIYFWEYFHRLWARLMGFVFVLPLMFFIWKGDVDKPLLRRLGIVFLLAALVASFGWIMVASGLINRPWVNAYKLTMHLSLAFLLYAYLLWTTFIVLYPQKAVFHISGGKRWIIALTVLAAVQIMLGGVMSGMKAGLYYPTWPDMAGAWIPDVLLSASSWTVENFVDYDKTPFMAALIQLLHRTTAYLLFILTLVFFFKAIKQVLPPIFKTTLFLLISMLIIQVLLGIFTLINCIGTVPVGLGVWHQAGALLLLSLYLLSAYQLVKPRN